MSASEMPGPSSEPEVYRALSITPVRRESSAPFLYELTGDSTEIGSGDDNAIVLSDPSVAPHHLAVRRDHNRDHLLVDIAERWRHRDRTWARRRPGDAYWCPRHGSFAQLDRRAWCPECKNRRGSLWLMRPLKPGDTFGIGRTFRATYVVQELPIAAGKSGPSLAAAFPSPDVFAGPLPARIAVEADEYSIPIGPQPTDDSNLWRWQPDGVPFPIFMHQRVNRAITQHARENGDREVGGVLLGDLRVDDQRQMFLVVTHALRAELATESRGHLTFTHNTWLKIHRAKDAQYPDKTILGWYHTHPGWTIFLSQWDLFIHQNFFKQPWQVAMVIDPTMDRAGFFVYKSGKVDRPEAPTEPFRLAELEGWKETLRPRVRIKLTDAPLKVGK